MPFRHAAPHTEAGASRACFYTTWLCVHVCVSSGTIWIELYLVSAAGWERPSRQLDAYAAGAALMVAAGGAKAASAGPR